MTPMAAGISDTERILQGKKSIKEAKHSKRSRLSTLKFWKKRKISREGGGIEHDHNDENEVNLNPTDQQDQQDRPASSHRRHRFWKRKHKPTSRKQSRRHSEPVIGTSPLKTPLSASRKGDPTTNMKENMVAAAKLETTTKIVSLPSPPLILVLILMDPETRRFELLKLEFETPDRTTIQDVVSQIPHAASDDVLRNQTYVGIGDLSGQELYRSTRLIDLSKLTKRNHKAMAVVEELEDKNGVERSDNMHERDEDEDSNLCLLLLGLPSGMDPYECSQLALPIIQDEQVQQMLTSIGIFTPWRDPVDDSSISSSSQPTSPVQDQNIKTKSYEGVSMESFEETYNTVSSPSTSLSKSFLEKYQSYKNEKKQRKLSKQHSKKRLSIKTNLGTELKPELSNTTEKYVENLLADKRIGPPPMDGASIPRSVVNYVILIWIGFFLLALSGFRSLQRDLEPKWHWFHLERKVKMKDTEKAILRVKNQVTVPSTAVMAHSTEETEQHDDLTIEATTTNQDSPMIEVLTGMRISSMDLNCGLEEAPIANGSL